MICSSRKMNVFRLFESKSSSKPRRDRWLFKLLQYRGILDVIIFTIVLLLKWWDVEEFFKENMFGDFCARGAEENKLIFCRNFIEIAIKVRLAAAICLTIGGYFVSAYSITGREILIEILIFCLLLFSTSSEVIYNLLAMDRDKLHRTISSHTTVCLFVC